MTSIVNTSDNKIVHSIFSYYDKDKDNYLNFEEFESLCDGLGFSLYDCQFAYIDTDKDKKISYQEFQVWWLSKNKFKILAEENIDIIFYTFDIYKKSRDNNGDVTFDNLSKFFKNNYGTIITKEQFQTIDKDKDGRLNFFEFCSWLNWF